MSEITTIKQSGYVARGLTTMTRKFFIDGTIDAYEWNDKEARMKASSIGLYGIANAVLWVFIFPLARFQSVINDALYIAIMCMLCTITNDVCLVSAVMGSAYWLIGMNFFPIQATYGSIFCNACVMHMCQQTGFNVLLCMFFIISRIVRIPRIYDLNPCSLIFGLMWIIVLTIGLTTLMINWIPGILVPFFTYPTFEYEQTFSQKTTWFMVYSSRIVLICIIVSYFLIK